MTPAEPTADQLRRDPLPLLGRVAVVTGVSRRAGIGYAIARRLAALGAGLFLHHYAPHDRDQPWGDDPGGPEAVIAGVTEALAGGLAKAARVQHGDPTSRIPARRTGSSRRPRRRSGTWTSSSATTPAAAATVPSAR